MTREISRPPSPSVGPGFTEAALMARLRRWFFGRKPDAGFLLEGFPATLLQARILDEWLETRHEGLDAVVAGSDAPAPVLAHYRGQGLGHRPVEHSDQGQGRDRAHARCRRDRRYGPRRPPTAGPGGCHDAGSGGGGPRCHRRCGARSACYGYQHNGRRYPAHTCISVNEEVVHGIPSLRRVLREGDIVSLDIVVEHNGYIGDNAITVPVAAHRRPTSNGSCGSPRRRSTSASGPPRSAPASATSRTRSSPTSRRTASASSATWSATGSAPRCTSRRRFRTSAAAAPATRSAGHDPGDRADGQSGRLQDQDAGRRLDGRHRRRRPRPPTSNTPCSRRRADPKS